MNSIPSIPDSYISNIRSYNLDLAYILPNLAACSAPTNKITKKLYQNNLDTLCEVLSLNHGDNNWGILNLRTEKIGYDPDTISKHKGLFFYKPFLDNNAIPLEEFIGSIKDLDTFLSENPKHAIVVHCRHGKGRTGSIIVGYLMYKFGLEFDTANKLFTTRRRIYRHGVSVPSQVRYLGYYGNLLNSTSFQDEYHQILSSNFKVCIKKLVIHNFGTIPNHQQLDLRCQTFAKHGSELSLVKIFTEDTINRSNGDLVVTPNEPIILDTMDISFQITVLGRFTTTLMLWFWINAAIEYVQKDVNSELTITIPWEKMDGYRGKEIKGKQLLDSAEVTIKLIHHI